MSVIRIEDGKRECIFVSETPSDVEIFVGKNAVLDYYILESVGALCSNGVANNIRPNNERPVGANNICPNSCRILIHQAEGSDVAIGCFSLHAEKMKHDIRIDLEGENASTKLFGVVIADGAQEIENTTYIDHKVKNCQSNELFKYILNDEAKAAFFGRIHVAHGAIKTDAHQTVRTLCLTDKTRMQAKPELEIYADDVKCSHGATVGQLDQNALFYMRTRGIPENEAKRLLMVAFVDDVLANVRDENLREELSCQIEQRLQ